ncbi:hypothetical protein GCM10020254_61330 [Streptomyces goshikiensis]
MRRLPGLIVPLLTVPLLALAGCGGGGQTRTAPPSVPASPSPLSPSPDPAPSPSPSSTRNRLCVPTTDMTTAERLAYFKDLSDSSHGASPAFFMTDSGVYLLAKETQRPCEAVRFQLSWFRVEMTRAGSGSSARYSFTYAPIESTTLSAGPRDGRVVGSVPPAAEGLLRDPVRRLRRRGDHRGRPAGRTEHAGRLAGLEPGHARRRPRPERRLQAAGGGLLLLTGRGPAVGAPWGSAPAAVTGPGPPHSYG